MAEAPSILPDLERRLRALESQRVETGLTRIVRLAKLVGYAVGGFAVGTVALVLLVERLSPPTTDSSGSVQVPMTRRNIVMMMLAFGAPVALGGAGSFAAYRRLRLAGSRAAYERRFAEHVAIPLAQAAIPHAAADAPTALATTRLEACPLLPKSMHPEFSKSRLRVSWTSHGIPAEAIACRLVERVANVSEQSQRTRVLHDGLIVWYALPDRWLTPLVIADARAYPQVRRLGLAIAEVADSRFRRSAPFLDDSSGWGGLLAGPSGWREMLKEPGQWSGLMIFGDDPRAAARAATPSVLDAAVQVAGRLDVPFAMHFSPLGVVMRIDGSGGFAPASNEDELLDRLDEGNRPGIMAEQRRRLEGDARLLASLPDVGRILMSSGG